MGGSDVLLENGCFFDRLLAMLMEVGEGKFEYQNEMVSIGQCNNPSDAPIPPYYYRTVYRHILS